MQKLIRAVAAVLLASCTLERAPTRTNEDVGLLSVSNPECNSFGNAANSNANWATTVVNNQARNIYPCASTITVKVVNGSAITSTVLSNAMAKWNGFPQGYGLPRFGSCSGSTCNVTITETGTGGYLCGTTVISTGAITITHSTTPTLCSDVPSAVPYQAHPLSQAVQLVAHELGHALGFKHHLRNASQSTIDQDTIVRDCIDVVPTALNSNVCEHERQIIYYQYALRNTNPLTDRVFLYGIDPEPTSLSLELNQLGTSTATLYLIDHNNSGGVLIAPEPGDVIQWGLNNLSPAGSFSITGTTAASATVRAVTVPCTGLLQADLISSASYNVVWPFNALEYKGQVVLSNPAPAAPPTNLAAMNVTSSSAVLNWTNGDPLASTTVQRRLTGSGSWTTVGGVPLGGHVDTLTGLAACTSYDANVFHVRNGYFSTANSLNGIRTPAASGACAPSNFAIASCFTTTSGGQTYRSYNSQWTRGEFAPFSTYQIGQASTNNPAGATIISSGKSDITTKTLGPYLASTGFYTLYFWVRHKLANGATSAWVALLDNPVNPTEPC